MHGTVWVRPSPVWAGKIDGLPGASMIELLIAVAESECHFKLLHSERPKLQTILASLSAIGLDI